MVNISRAKAVRLSMTMATHPGAQTERRGGAGPVRGLLGGKDLTGRFCSSVVRTNEIAWLRTSDYRLLTTSYQSEPSTSPPLGVTAAAQVAPLRLGASVRTLPSTKPTWMPPA